MTITAFDLASLAYTAARLAIERTGRSRGTVAARHRLIRKARRAMVAADSLAGEPITQRLTEAPGNGRSFGGLKVSTQNGWFAARPSGTEDVYKIYAESFNGTDHLKRLQAEAQAIVAEAFASAGA